MGCLLVIRKLFRQLGHAFFLIIRNRNRTLLTVLGIILTTTLYTTSVLSMNNIALKDAYYYQDFPEGAIYIEKPVDKSTVEEFSEIFTDVPISVFQFGEELETEYTIIRNEQEEELKIQMIGVEIDYLSYAVPSLDVDDSLEQPQLISGRNFTESDYLIGNHVVHLYEATAQLLFGLENPIGQTIYIDGEDYVVVGLLQNTPDIIRVYANELTDPIQIYVPIELFPETTVYSKAILNFPLNTTTSIDRMVKDFFNANGISTTYNDVQYKIHIEMESTLALIDMILILLLILSSISIMVIMVFGIKERVFEFGIKRAVGASDGDITLQIGFEALILGVIGAVLGIGIGILLSFIISVYLISSYGMFVFNVDFLDLVNPFYYSLLFTLIFSFVPAIIATRINIVTALKTD